MRSNEFIFGDDQPWVEASPGLYRQVLGHDDNMLMARIRFNKGAIGSVHEHVHSQTSYVISGKFEVQIAGEKKQLITGDAFYIPPHVLHGAVCLEAGELIDTFSPTREDFLK